MYAAGTLIKMKKVQNLIPALFILAALSAPGAASAAPELTFTVTSVLGVYEYFVGVDVAHAQSANAPASPMAGRRFIARHDSSFGARSARRGPR